MRAFVIITCCCTFFSCYHPKPLSDMPSGLDTSALLRDYSYESLLSVVLTEKESPRAQLLKWHPNSEIVSLLRKRDPLFIHNGYVFGLLFKELGAKYYYKDLILCLSDRDPLWRAFGCSALKELGDFSAIRQLRKLVDDKSAVPSCRGCEKDETVGSLAQSAINELQLR